MAHTCRGTINLGNATIEPYDSHTFVISNGATQTYHLKTSSEVERKKWVTALILAKSKAISLVQADDDDMDSFSYSDEMDRESEITLLLRNLNNQLNELTTGQQMVKRNGESLIKLLSEIENMTPQTDTFALMASGTPILPGSSGASTPIGGGSLVTAGSLSASDSINPSVHESSSSVIGGSGGGSSKNGTGGGLLSPGTAVSVSGHAATGAGMAVVGGVNNTYGKEHGHAKSHSYGGNIVSRYKAVNEKATVFKCAISAMINKCTEFETFAASNGRRWQRLLANECENRTRLEKMVEELARQHSALEKKVQSQASSGPPPGTRVNPDATGVLSGSPGSHLQDFSMTGEGLVVGQGGQITRIYLPGHSQSKREGAGEDSEDGDGDSFVDACETLEEDIGSDAFIVSVPPSPGGTAATSAPGGGGVCASGIGRPGGEVDLSPFSPDLSESESCSDWESDTPQRPGLKVKVTLKRAPGAPRSGQQKQKGTRSSRPKSHLESQSSETSLKTGNEGDKSSEKAVMARQSQQQLVGSSRFPAPKERRTFIPPRPNISVNLWGIMKNCIGKELSKIPVPVNFNEPLSMLQRLTEDLEYSCVLDAAAQCSDSIEQLAHVAAFTVSSYSTTTTRSGKPFNPLLGETFECDRRDDMGWRCVAEQVSHHPPAAAFYCESSDWRCWQEFTMSSKFRGKYLAIIPMGIAHLTFNSSGNHYTWRKVTSTVHNIIVGRLWIDNHGEMEIHNHKTGDVCLLSYKAYSYFSRDTPRRVTGVITDSAGKAKYVLNGTWDEYLEGAKVTAVKGTSSGQPEFETGPTKLLWRRTPAPQNSDKMYNFTKLAIELNESEEGVALTDSRLRPDQRLMENGHWDEANREKERLEEKQRTKRKLIERTTEEAKREGRKPPPTYEPLWFKPSIDEQTGNHIHMFNGKYWNMKESQDWEDCPDIF